MTGNKRKRVFTIAFYNVENLFDTFNDRKKIDDDFTPKGRKKWNKKKYYLKIKKLSNVIALLGKNFSAHKPILLGLAEVENKKVIEDLISQKKLSNCNYKIIHHESPDERGIDVALVYNHDFFEINYSKALMLDVYNDDDRDYTRDILLVSGKLNGELIYIFVNHWPSRRQGAELTKHKRIKAAETIHKAIEDIKKESKNPKIIIMGDFNDNPTNESIQQHLVNDEFYNPMEKLFKSGQGTLTFNKKWDLFDQIIISKSFFDKSSKHSFLKAEVFKKKWMKIKKGKYKGSPFRSYIGPWYKDGYSDHFPVCTYFEQDD